MTLSEFDLIDTFFAGRARQRADVRLGIGDDAAIVRVAPDQDLVVAVDTLIDGVHFPSDLPGWNVGYRALAVNLSDLAAMGARARWFTLSLTLPGVDTDWLGDFADGLIQLADDNQVALVGGDTTRGALSVSVQVLGELPTDQGLRRGGARAGDLVCVSGMPGSASFGLKQWQAGERRGTAVMRFLQPQPRLQLGSALRELATAAIDISDGLWADLNHLLRASDAGAELDLQSLPRPMEANGLSDLEWNRFVFSGGDDYELCFTLAPDQIKRVVTIAAELDLTVTAIGEIVAEPGIHLPGIAAEFAAELAGGYRHF